MTHTLTDDQHRAMEGVAPFELPEVAFIAGRKIAGTRARVYWLLRTTAEQRICHRIGQRIGPAGWVPGYYFQRPWSGGGAGDRRRRDLSEKFGVTIETSRFDGDSSIVLYRWVSDPAAAPVESRSPEASSSERSETRPLARGGQMGGFSPETGTSGSPALPAAPARLRFWTSVGFPGSAAHGRLQIFEHGGHPLALSPEVVGHVVRGDLTVAAALEAYSATLKGRWHQLRTWLAAGGEHVLWVAPEVAETINPLPLLAEILTKCGAEFMGDWNQDRQAGVA